MKQSKIFLGLLVATLLLITTKVSADMLIFPKCNSVYFLEYGKVYSSCVDYDSTHNYSTIGWTYGTPNTRVAVYVLNKDGKTMDSDSSSGYNDVAVAEWAPNTETKHKHKAGSSLLN